MQTWSGRFSSNKTTHLFLAFLVLRNRTVCHFTRHESWRLSNRHNFLYVVKRYTRQFRVSLLELKEHRQTRTHFVSAKNRRQSCYGTSEAGFRPTSQKTCHNALNWGHSVVTTFITFPPVVRQQKARFSRQIYARVFPFLEEWKQIHGEVQVLQVGLRSLIPRVSPSAGIPLGLTGLRGRSNNGDLKSATVVRFWVWI